MSDRLGDTQDKITNISTPVSLTVCKALCIFIVLYIPVIRKLLSQEIQFNCFTEQTYIWLISLRWQLNIALSTNYQHSTIHWNVKLDVSMMGSTSGWVIIPTQTQQALFNHHQTNYVTLACHETSHTSHDFSNFSAPYVISMYCSTFLHLSTEFSRTQRGNILPF